jgi:hypothetical protein
MQRNLEVIISGRRFVASRDDKSRMACSALRGCAAGSSTNRDAELILAKRMAQRHVQPAAGRLQAADAVGADSR